jgi:hypothetical protein
MHRPHEQVMRELDEAQLRGDVDKFASYFTDDVAFHIPGKSSLPATIRGKIGSWSCSSVSASASSTRSRATRTWRTTNMGSACSVPTISAEPKP